MKGRVMKKLLSGILTLSMLASLSPPVFAGENTAEGDAHFDFEASEYEIAEDSGELKIKVIRHGGNSEAADVYFKAADFLASYGNDYEILDEHGSPLEKVYGEKPELSEFVYQDETEELSETDMTEEGSGASEGVSGSDVQDATEKPSDDDQLDETEDSEKDAEVSGDQDSGKSDTEPVAEVTEKEEESSGNLSDTASVLPENTDKKRKSSGSPLLDAQAAYLNLDTSEKENVEDATKETLDDMYSYFLSAEGAQGVLHFRSGETEKEIIVKIYDNDAAESDKLFMLALLGTTSESTTIAANATTYVSIIDDEDYETPVFALTDTDLTLSSDAPEGYITVQRKSGMQYFSMVYVSTVKSSAAAESYEEFEGKTVAFVPGETEKKVRVTAYDFSKDAAFGVRLEGGEDTEIENHYVEVKISADPSAQGTSAQNVPAANSLLSAGNVSLLSDGITLGASTSMPANQIGVEGGWKAVRTGSDNDNRAQVNGSDLYLTQYDKNKYSMLVTNNRINFTGIKNLRFSMNVGGDGSKFTTWLDTDTDQTFEGSYGACYTQNGKSGWAERDLNVASVNESLYLKFSTKATAAGKHNPKATIDWFRFEWAKYSFSPQNSVESLNRKLYDFTSGTPAISDLFYDGETNRVYNPGTVTVKSGTSNVDAFYGNNEKSVTIADANPSRNTEKGIYLKGVYFCKGDISEKEFYDGNKYRSKNVYYVSANNAHEVVVTPNQSFIKTLIDNGVLSSQNKDETIKIFPVFEQEMVTVNFENADRDDSDSSSKGKFDKEHRASYIINILEACDAGTVTKKLHAGWLDYYSISVPKYAVIRVKTSPAANRSASGVRWWYHSDNSKGGVEYYQEGDTKFSGANSAGVVIEETDYTMADIVADASLSMCPSTGEQTFYVGYSPKSYEYITGVVDSLTNAVRNTTDSGNGEATGDDGSMWLINPYIGLNYTLSAIAPEGYYTSWANMTGDDDNSGTIGDSSADDNTAGEKRKQSENPMYVYGSKLNVSLDQDNTRYYYEFLPKTNSATITQRGQVLREKNTLYDLAAGREATDYEPVIGAYMDIAGFTGMTDGEGRYSIPMMGLPSWGTISASLSVGDAEYNATASIESNSRIILPALEKFRAKAVSAAYETKTGSIADNMITVEDDTLTIRTTVTSDSAIRPSGARFFIYNDQGYETIDCSEHADDYRISSSNSGGDFTASLTFNPKKDMAFGYKVYVQYCDQNGKWYAPVDTGYDFYAALDLASFIFPMIGSSSLEDVVTTGIVEDIIGNPLGDIDLGSIDAFDVTGESYTPENIPPEDRDKYTWLQNNYSFGFSKKLASGSKSWDSKKSYEDKMKKYMEALQNGDLTGEMPSKSQYDTKGSFKWSVTPSVGFNLTLSSRSDGNTYFEDLIFYVKVGFGVSAEQTIELPIGLSILISGELSGDITGIYHMYTDYQDSYETEGAIPYTSEDFGVFKKFNSDVRREGYLFLNPEIGVKLGIGYGIIFVTGSADFKFDMDLQFTESSTNAYGDVTIDLGWGIELVGFTVYSKSLYNTTEKMFSTEGQNGHIDFDYETENTLSMASLSDMMTGGGDESLITDQPVSRDYLSNRGSWNSGRRLLSALNASSGTEETVLRNGAADNPNVSVTKIGDGKMLMVFVDDDTSRNNVNKRAVYYSIGDGTTWSEPELIDDDGTLDDYPNVYDLGDRLLISWSSAEKVFGEDATVEDALKSLNIKAVFFDKQSETFGQVEQLTKTTDEDYAADVLPRAAYDSSTGRIILYYTKTEYDELEKTTDIADAVSVTAYLFYEDGKWSNDGSVYTEEELDGVDNPERYKEQWYGQRFLDVRINGSNSEMLRVVDTDAVSYNGLSLFAWTVDWDKNLTTTNDRDVFLQIYDFSENSFTHNIRITPESGTYASPKFGRTGQGNTYLFYGAQGEGEDHGQIMYLNISDIISNEQYTKVSENGSEYYTLQYENDADSYELPDGTTVTVPAETVTVQADIAAETDNITDYDVYVDSDGRMYLFWTGVVGSSREIFASMFNGTDTGDTSEDGDEEDAYWSEPFALTDGGENVYYSGIGASVIDNTIYIGSGKGIYNDASSSSLVLTKHEPYTEVSVGSVTLDKEYPQAGDAVKITALVKNDGLLPEYDPVTVTFTRNGEEIGTQQIQLIPGGDNVSVSVYTDMPEDISGTVFGAYIAGKDPVTVSAKKGAQLVFDDGAVSYFKGDGYTEAHYAYTVSVENTGNDTSEEVIFTAYSEDDTVLGEATVPSLAAGESTAVDMTLDIPDSAYEIADGQGNAGITVRAAAGGEEILNFETTVRKQFDANAISLLTKVTGVRFENNGKYNLATEDEVQIQPDIIGAEEGQLKVKWLESSDENVAVIDYSNTILASEPGTATLTGIVVPYEDVITFDSAGNMTNADWRGLIPSEDMITVTVQVTVSEKGTEPEEPSQGGSGGHGGSSVKPENPSEPEEPEEPTEPENPSEITFSDTAGHWAEKDIERLASEGIISGVGEGRFEPNGQITRAQFAQLLMNMNLVPSGDIEVPQFRDVNPDAWYSEAVTWAVSCGAAKGMGDGTFAPDAPITREQMAAMMNRFLKLAGIEITAVTEKDFTDESAISDWAAADVKTLTEAGIINGRDDGRFDPENDMTRAESAAVICRVLDIETEHPAAGGTEESPGPENDADKSSLADENGSAAEAETENDSKGNPAAEGILKEEKKDE